MYINIQMIKWRDKAWFRRRHQKEVQMKFYTSTTYTVGHAQMNASKNQINAFYNILLSSHEFLEISYFWSGILWMCAKQPPLLLSYSSIFTWCTAQGWLITANVWLFVHNLNSFIKWQYLQRIYIYSFLLWLWLQIL